MRKNKVHSIFIDGKDFLIRKEDDGCYTIYDRKNIGFFRFDGIGFLLFDLMSKELSFGQLVDYLYKKSDLPREDIYCFVDEFVKSLVEKRAISEDYLVADNTL